MLFCSYQKKKEGMLSFQKRTDKDHELAWGYSDPGFTKKVFTVWHTKRSKESAIVSDDVLTLLRGEQIRIMSDFGLSLAEFTLLCGHASRNLEADAAWPRGIKRAYMEIIKMADAKLKRELEFGPEEDVYMVPAFNPIKPKTNYITTAWSSSGGGKTTALCGLLMRAPHLEDVPKVYVFGSVADDDPAWEPLRKRLEERFVAKDVREMKAEDFNYRNYERHAVLVFDDCNSISDKHLRRSMLAFLDTTLEVARHRSQVIMASQHLFHAYQATARMRNSSRYMALFPRNTPKVLNALLDKDYGWARQRRIDMVDKCKTDCRMTWLSKNHPSFLLTEKRLVLL
jgi:hypothetical protein